MIRPVRALLAALLMAVAVLPAAAQPRRRTPPPAPAPAPPPPPDIRVRSELTQTAAWVGDPLAFVVQVDMAPGVEVVADDLAPEKLTVEGLELGEMTLATEDRADGWRTVTRRYRVTAWDTTPPKRIADFVVRFRRPVTAAAADGSAPAAELKVPGATLAMRSTLPDDGSASGARDRQATLAAPAWIEWLRPGGFGLIALGAAPVVLWLLGRARRPRVTRPRASSRSLQAQLKGMFDELTSIDTSTADGRRRVFDRIDQDVRAYLAQAEAVPAQALTADELRPRLAGSRRVKGDVVCDVLAACEHARYGPAEQLPDADVLGERIGQLRAALGR